MIIYIEFLLWNNKNVPAMIDIDTLLQAQEGATIKVPSHMNHHLGIPRIVINTRRLMIVVDHHHLMTTIDMRHHMIIANTSHLMFAIDQHLLRIFDDTPQDMVMMQEDGSLDMKRQRLQWSTTPTIWCLQSLAPPPQWHLQDRLNMRRSPMALHQQARWCQVQRKRNHISWCFPLLPPPPQGRLQEAQAPR